MGKEEGLRFRGADYEICRWRYFLSVKKVTKERRGFAVGAPARRSRDGNGKTSAPVGPMTGQPGFAAGEMRPNGSKGRVFAVGDPARQSRDGDGKILVRGDEVMAAKRTTAQGGFAQRNAARDFARQTQKVGPVTARAVSPQAKRRRKPTSAGVRARGHI